MTKKQKEFVRGLIRNLKSEMLKLNVPEDWDGMELRWLVRYILRDFIMDKKYFESRWKDFKRYIEVHSVEVKE